MDRKPQTQEGRGGVSTITPFAMETAQRYLNKKKEAQHQEYLLKFACGFLGVFVTFLILFVGMLSYKNVQLEKENFQLVGNLRQLSILLNAVMVQSDIDHGTLLIAQQQEQIRKQADHIFSLIDNMEDLPKLFATDDWLTVPEESEPAKPINSAYIPDQDVVDKKVFDYEEPVQDANEEQEANKNQETNLGQEMKSAELSDIFDMLIKGDTADVKQESVGNPDVDVFNNMKEESYFQPEIPVEGEQDNQDESEEP